MEIEIDLTKSVDENAGTYFNLAKKAKKKIEGAKKAVEVSKKKLEKLQKDEDKFMEVETKKLEKKERKKEWYEKFHWFVSSEDFLCVGGKDATSNEIIVKKHTDKDDLVFHTEMAGSPFFIVKNGQSAKEETINEAAQATGVYSRAWKLGHTTADVFYVKPEQVSKEAQSGEYMSKGSFMVRGKSTFVYPRLEYAIGLVDTQKPRIPGTASDGAEIIGGPLTAIKKRTNKFVKVIPGKYKKSALAKKIRSKLKGGDLDDIIKFLPAGGAEIKK
ncbi:DUF814 domain-containing protein [Candidatus Woesearchaeota archaeon]|jgi:predicted ribosome quality control (RQC) complex YloA/Tae2 family protein|nr:DUF814 domain-containing protein [Candidatus Woesearchaeota archaeon]MBT4336437.1 DUF814 domain-containing protein [Candidatus Woesearchaeota archaeon]MBT4469850.1 DUF814 domain-containing protein [Candidatus Woesearchaeota archaeon]MBT6744479.1 DUF814 domain-containing protein [Candidatus Woesearchaeota archaeon]